MTQKQVQAAKRNVKKAQAAARRKRTIANLPKSTRRGLGQQAAKSRSRGGSAGHELETTVYRLVQETLSNVAKHARAERVGVRVAVDYDVVRVEVADDGRGFNPDAPVEGFGLVGIRERVALAGGQLEIESGPSGTVVRASLPVERSRAARAS